MTDDEVVRPSVAAARPPPGGGNALAYFFGFERLLTPGLVQLVYYVGLAGIILFVFLVFGAFASAMGQSGSGGGSAALLVGLLFAGFGVIFWRVVCELALLQFRIYDRLGEIRDRLGS